MRVEILTCMAGSDFVHNHGDVVEFEDSEAARLIAAGYARPAEQVETASVAPAENAAQKRGRPRVNRTGDGA